MNEQTRILIEQLATKLGTTGEHLWSVLVRQAPISSVTDLVTLIAVGLATWLAGQAFIKGIQGRNDGFDDEGRNIALAFAGGIACLVLGAWTIAIISDLSLIVAGFFNPEFWALKQIIK